MSESSPHGSSRREFLQNTGRVAAATALVSMAVPKVHASEDNTARIALIGCGGRGGGAADNALRAGVMPAKLVAMADVFQGRLDTAYNALSNRHSELMDVPEDRRFIGFDAYQKAIDCLRRATSRSLPRRRPFAGYTSSTPSRRASTSSWKSRSLSTARPRARCSPWPRKPTRRT